MNPTPQGGLTPSQNSDDATATPSPTPKAHLDVDGYRPAGPKLTERRGKVHVAVIADEEPFNVLAVLVCSLWTKGARTLLAKRIARHGVPDAEAAVARLTDLVWRETAT